MLERFEKREYAVNGAAVVLYLRALLATNAIAEYLPDENKSRASGLPRLVRIDIHRGIFKWILSCMFCLQWLY